MVILRYDKERKEWDEIDRGEPRTKSDIVFSRRWKNTLDYAKKDIAKDNDACFLFTGAVGSGKSTMAKLSCRYMSDEEFDPTVHLVKNVGDIKIAINGATKGNGAVLFDEASKMAAATNTMTKGTKHFHEVLDVCRQKNLFIALCAPSFPRLTSQLAIDRTKVMARVYVDKKSGARGRYAFYGNRLKEKLYLTAKKNFGSLKFPRPKYRGTFGDDLLNKEVYIKLKDDTLQDTLNSFEDLSKPKRTPQQLKRDLKLDIVSNNMNMKVEDLAKILNVSDRTIERFRADVREAMSLKYDEIGGHTKGNQRKAAISDEYNNTVGVSAQPTHHKEGGSDNE